MAHKGFIKKISQRFEDDDRYFKGSKLEGTKNLKKGKRIRNEFERENSTDRRKRNLM